MAMSGHEGKQGRSAAGAIALVFVVLLPLFYVLSIGPAAWMMKHKHIPDNGTIETIYFPLMWLHENVNIARQLLEWYVAIWER
jgi:hypothetical protein